MASDPTLIELDSRRRASLAKLAKHDRYLASEEPDGTIVLVPAVVITELEARFRANPELVAKVKDNMAHPERRVRHPRPAIRSTKKRATRTSSGKTRGKRG
jgi:hypothetical protein